MRKRLPRRDGFTLIEMLIVIVVIGVLAAIVVPRIIGAGKGAAVASAQQVAADLTNALRQCEAAAGVKPTVSQVKDWLTTAAGSTKPTGWPTDKVYSGPYIDPWPNDPNNNNAAVNPGSATTGTIFYDEDNDKFALK